ncbi:DNA adenine methylase [Serratia symbiotica]|uniref:site-specific DNA-methyltransferase (adenine-specific) n=2 Tax=Serratia symbiotica TaxID=138074 RepID=A0A455VR39_9GAMM|nr:DNA adenine methylase [Serratia symbiotica]BBI91284.1 DNA adenine methylase [Serratia symbiotica]BBI92395.1 DNA adenine methylase [Serratia symbiotica]
MSDPIIPWVGGKRRLAKHLLPLFPQHKCYVEPFCGGAALFFRKKASKVEVINDINGELINLYRVVKNHLEEFVRQFKWALSSRQIFDWQKATPTEVLTDIQRAARFYYLQNMAFGSKVEGQTFGTATTAPMGINLLRLEETLSIAHLRLARTTIENLSWVECIEKYDRPHTLFYLDPPYWGTQGYGVEFGLEQYEAIAHLARTIKGNMIISVNDIPEMRQAFSDLQIEVVSLKYSLGNSSLARCELIVRNFT